ncbi:nucleolar RNA-binding protein, putative [Trypanosoma equiperdum]|uniref:Nucleolar RNA-binding protein, putative n=3 Tax=Trypanozoon TaxID=39700 RepID=Q57YF6_TRYB2|nr:nucleolar RNA-binding protein, putative [Trypanosoma brucei gambiense DAL972]XP_846912.1 nucleolar RNA-binding protein, putative [Trypanosoma brucei brucei TREU927]AAX69363.1 nucleolar RNA-binding protein, putative [Trypanosoma brucei]SCU66017.1 nucleolar RNA-binding protein, putative [Trypanosoma equiperdum]AAZ12846.1 nucleolar RNA-binding protein, putative [Trypanosoma brucei brucei TREU927]CBH13083.1 nucleolar RNA-binding protein, putative [Trypanosoma brucei gambiense DAL972]|eukprot:XP_011775360.1 nucleolar RNA-binding protein, putative [Trypanosoma brucei gambiense DAL972]
MEGFYGVEVSVGEKVIPEIPEGNVLRLTQIAVPANTSDAVSLVVSLQGKEFTIASLDPVRNVSQMGIDLVIKAEQNIILSATGNGSVHVTGYIQPIENVTDGESSCGGEICSGVPFEKMAPPPFRGVAPACKTSVQSSNNTSESDYDVEGIVSVDDGVEKIGKRGDKGEERPSKIRHEGGVEFHNEQHVDEHRYRRGGYFRYNGEGGYGGVHQGFFRQRGRQRINSTSSQGGFGAIYNEPIHEADQLGMNRGYGRGGYSSRGRGYMGGGYRGQANGEMRRGYTNEERYLYSGGEWQGMSSNLLGRGFAAINRGFHPYSSRNNYPFPPNHHLNDASRTLPPYSGRGGTNAVWNRGGFRGGNSGRGRY